LAVRHEEEMNELVVVRYCVVHLLDFDVILRQPDTELGRMTAESRQLVSGCLAPNHADDLDR